MSMDLGDDRRLDELARFARQRIAPLTEDPAQRWPEGTLLALGQEMLTLDASQRLWVKPGEAENLRLSVTGLQLLARFSSEIALHLHRACLGRYLLAQLSWQDVDSSTLALVTQGHYGLGGGGLPRYLGGHPLARDDEAIRGHGFDELGHFYIATYRDDHHRQSQLSAEQARQVLALALAMDCLGLLAVATGSLRRGVGLGIDYAKHRHQGGQPIARYPAVQLMQGNMWQALRRAEAELDWFCARPPLIACLPALLACRAGIQHDLRLAADELVQLHGGMGYLRDHGAEKVLREQNQLLLLTGTPMELRLLAAACETTA